MMRGRVLGGIGKRSAAPDRDGRLTNVRPALGYEGTAVAQSFFSGARSPWHT